MRRYCVCDGGQYPQRVDASVAQQPDAGFQHCRACFDALLELALGIEGEYRDAIEVDALVAAADWR